MTISLYHQHYCLPKIWTTFTTELFRTVQKIKEWPVYLLQCSAIFNIPFLVNQWNIHAGWPMVRRRSRVKCVRFMAPLRHDLPDGIVFFRLHIGHRGSKWSHRRRLCLSGMQCLNENRLGSGEFKTCLLDLQISLQPWMQPMPVHLDLTTSSSCSGEHCIFAVA